MRRYLRPRTLIIIVVAALVAGIVPFALLQGFGPPPFLPPPPQDVPVPRQVVSQAEADAIYDRMYKEGRLIRTRVSGPETAGSTIEVAGKQIKLPPDTYVYAYVIIADCVVGTPCPEPPVYGLKRGGSQVTVEKRSGKLWYETIAPGEVDPFKFLKEGLR